MKIIDVRPNLTHYVDIKINQCATLYYRRNSKDCWEQLFGSSWQSVSYKEEIELEEYFQKFMQETSNENS